MSHPLPVPLESPDRSDPYARARHARYFETSCVYHVVSRTAGNLFLLRPDEKGELRRIVVGVHAQARERYPAVRVCAAAWLSNHLHELLAILSGDATVLSDYMRFIKGEVSRRWKRHVGWTTSLFGGRYQATAVITQEGQRSAFKYVLSQGVKENLVERPQDWPGFHCAQSILTGEPLKGYWFEGTKYQRAKHRELAKSNGGHPPNRKDYESPRQFTFDKLPAFEHLADPEYRAMARALVDEIVQERKETHKDTRPLGVRAICTVSPRESRPIPKPQWFEERRRMIFWDSPKAPEVTAYLERYWSFQLDFRVAAEAWKNADMPVRFPHFAFVPGRRFRPAAHMEQSAA